MAITVIIPNREVTEVLRIVEELRQQGLVQGKDFDFSYSPPEHDFQNGHIETRHTKFTFYSEKYATLFTLKYL